MPVATRSLFVCIFALISCTAYLGLKLLHPFSRECTSCHGRMWTIRPLKRVLYKVREDSVEELRQVTANWQRWAEYPPCRFNAKPTDWETGQVPLSVVFFADKEMVTEGAIREAWDQLPDRVKWCFGTPEFKYSAADAVNGSILRADADLWPIRDNWLNATHWEETKGIWRPGWRVDCQSDRLPTALQS